MIEVIFYVLSALTLGSAFMTILSKNPIHSAIWLVVSFFSIAGHYALFNSQFLAMVHIIVYSGAIMILMLFTIMLMNLNISQELSKPLFTKIIAVVCFGLIGLTLLTTLLQNAPAIESYIPTGKDYQSIEVLGKILLNEFVVPFEMAAILLLMAMIGAVLISKKDQTTA
ncbi:MAG TPA: NADH-quinone oxidoreductase subunit J [Flavobacterium sp.]|nr:NADH-quinone oxidoreductase subunit J [Flavobacterium sp.]